MNVLRKILGWLRRVLRRLFGVEEKPKALYTLKVSRPVVTLTERTTGRQVFVKSTKRVPGQKEEKVPFRITNAEDKPDWLGLTVRKHKSGNDVITIKRNR